ncbi:MAG: hypothetical protein JRH11_22315 [Deltaproteobacteria bacterium]|nr:hypothetical protein [Deltaproteobacteria bacterium]
MADDHEAPYRGEYPDVQDEAATSPKWLPGLGFAILCVLALFVAIQAATAHEAADATGDAPNELAAEAADGDTPLPTE